MSEHNCVGTYCPDHPEGPEVQASPALAALLERTQCPECGYINQSHDTGCTRGGDES